MALQEEHHTRWSLSCLSFFGVLIVAEAAWAEDCCERVDCHSFGFSFPTRKALPKSPDVGVNPSPRGPNTPKGLLMSPGVEKMF